MGGGGYRDVVSLMQYSECISLYMGEGWATLETVRKKVKPIEFYL